jgi:sugar phosphate isomerase/epimerase
MAVELGVDVVQIADNLPLHVFTDTQLEEIREAAGVRGLTLQAGTRGVEPAHLLRYIAITHRVGAKILRTLTHTATSKPDIATVEDWIREILPALEQHEVTLAVENNESHRAAEYASLIRHIGSPHVGICLDTANSLGRAESLETVVQHLAEHTVVLHAKDHDIQRIDTRMGFVVVGRPAGEGRVAFDWLFNELLSRGRDVSVILEHWPPFVGSIEETVRLEDEWVARSVRFLKSRLCGATAPGPLTEVRHDEVER